MKNTCFNCEHYNAYYAKAKNAFVFLKIRKGGCVHRKQVIDEKNNAPCKHWKLVDESALAEYEKKGTKAILRDISKTLEKLAAYISVYE